MTTKYKDLVGYSRFEGYLNTWFDQTAQMKNIIVLNSTLPEGTYHIEANKSYLDKEFFKSFKALGDQEGEQDETDGQKQEQDLKSVSISFMRTSWICG